MSELKGAYESDGVPLRVFLEKKGPVNKQKKVKFLGFWVPAAALAERSLDPSTVEGEQVPPQDLPPDPFEE